MRFTYLLGLLATALVFSGCAVKPKVAKNDPFLVSKKEFRQNIKIIAMAPVEMVEGLPDPTPIEEAFDSLIVAELYSAGYSVVRPHEYTAIWNRITAEEGGFRDSTGGRDEERLTSAMFRTLKELRASFEIDAVLFPDIVVVEAQFAAGTAVWDGAEQRIETGGPATSIFSGSQRGVVGALSLRVSMRGRDGTTLFVNSGGIEVLSTISGKEFSNVPRQELFTNDERNRESVKIALKPLRR
ncbi:MAG: hypothetical protein JSW58_00820 [Candidatus Latescibacterota bacterium]|nr:MAG: hypothetical protein JSW58_00820 [Candidatus Latescibacterota bacterium]